MATSTPAIRVSWYHLDASQFTGTTYTLQLRRPLAPDYFVQLWPQVSDGSVDRDPPVVAVRVSADPFGTGGLAESGGADLVQLTRGNAAVPAVLTVQVVECLHGQDGAGFRLRDVVVASLNASTGGGAHEQDVAVAGDWADIDQVWLVGGLFGGGASCAAGADTSYATVTGRLSTVEPTPGDQYVRVRRFEALGAGLAVRAATWTVHVVEWGSEWTVQAVAVEGTLPGGADTDPDNWLDEPLATPVAPGRTIAFGTAYTEDTSDGAGPLSLRFAVGDGVDFASLATEASVYSAGNVDTQAVIYLATHASLAVAWYTGGAAAGTDLTAAVAVAAPPATEDTDDATYGVGRRAIGSGWSHDSGTTTPPSALWWWSRTSTAVTFARVLQATTNTTRCTVWVADFGAVTVAHVGQQVQPDGAGTQLAGVMIPLALTLWDAESDYTEAGLVAGDAVAQATTTDLALEAWGPMEAGDRLDVAVHRAGYLGPGGAGFRFRHNGTGDWYGADRVYAPTEFGFIHRGSSATDGYASQHVVSTPDGWVLVVADFYDSGAGTHAVGIWRRHPDTGVYSAVAVYSVATSAHLAPCLMLLPGGRVRLYHRVPVLSTAHQVVAWDSLDNGATWALVATGCLPGTITGTVMRMRAARGPGGVLLLMHVQLTGAADHDDELFQYASRDEGLVFELVQQGTGSTATDVGGYCDLAVVGDTFVVAWLYTQGGPYFARLAAASQPLSDAVAISPTPPTANVSGVGWAYFSATSPFTFGDGEMALVADDDGVLWAFGRWMTVSGNAQQGVVCYSTDSGRSWQYLQALFGSIFLYWWRGTSTWYPANFAACAHRGRVILVGNHVTPSSTLDNSLVGWCLGGFANVNLPATYSLQRMSARVSWDISWNATELPHNAGWTRATSGTPATGLSAVGGGCLGVAADAGESDRWHVSPTTTEAQGLLVSFQVWVTSSGATDHAELMDVRIGDGATGYELAIREEDDGAGASTFYVVDRADGSETVLATGIAKGQWVEWLIGLQKNTSGAEATAGFWYRLVAPSGGEALPSRRTWTEAWVSTTWGDDGGGGTYGTNSPHIRWGGTAGATDPTAYAFRSVRYAAGERTGYGVLGMLNNPTDLAARGYSTEGGYVDAGVELRAVVGPGRIGDEHRISPYTETPATAMLVDVEPSPQVGWLAASATAQQVAYRLNELGEDQYLGADVLGVLLQGLACPAVTLEVYRAGAWEELLEIDCTLEVAYVRRGARVIPSGAGVSGSAGAYLQRHELAGGHFQFADGTVRPVLGNGQGTWDAGPPDEVRPYLDLGDVDGTEDVAGTGRLWFPRAAAVLHLAGRNVAEGLRLSFAAPAGYTHPSAWSVGTFAIGPIAVWGQRYSRGWTWEMEHNAELFTRRNGARSAVVRGPPRRGFQASWLDTTDLRRVWGVQASDYLLGTTTPGAEPIAHPADPALLAEGLLAQLNGPAAPVVMFPYVPVGPPDTVVFTWQRCRGAMLARITNGAVSRTSVVGEEQVDETVRVNTLRLAEEV